MEKFINKALLIDGSYMVHRALKSQGLSNSRTSGGDANGGFIGAMRILQKELALNVGYYPVVVFDSGLSPRRLQLYPNYKKALETVPMAFGGHTVEDDYKVLYRKTKNDLKEMFTAIGIPTIVVPNTEGDDLIYALTKCCNNSIVLSDDKDMIQLVSDTCKIRRPMADETLSIATCDDFYKYPRYMYYKALIGDPSDNISQTAKGVGATTCKEIAKILSAPGSISLVEKLILAKNNTQYEKLWKKIQIVIDNFSVFERNMALMDFGYVQIPLELQNIVEGTMYSIVGKYNIFEAYKMLGKYDIVDIDPGQIIGLVQPYSKHILIENI